jgi:hypothetical protein
MGSALREVPKPLSLPAIIDEFGDLDREIQLFAQKVKRHKELRDLIGEAVETRKAEKPIILRGTLYELQLSPRKAERTVTDKTKLFGLLKKLLGLDALIAALTIPLGLIDKWVPDAEDAGLAASAATGIRTITVVPLARPQRRA